MAGALWQGPVDPSEKYPESGFYPTICIHCWKLNECRYITIYNTFIILFIIHL